MCGGGGSVPQDNSLEVERQRQAYEREQRAAQEAKEAREKAEREAKFAEALAAAEAATIQRAQQTAASRGLTYEDYEPLFTNEIALRKAGIPALDANPAAYLPLDLADIVLGREEGNRRAQYTNQLKSTFTPNYSMNAFGDTADDAIIDAILGSQYTDALDSVERARTRGTINDVGYNRALAELEGMRTAGRSTANTIGGTVLSRNRGMLDAIRDEGMGGAASYTLGTTFDPTFYTSRADAKKNELMGSLEGDVRGALSGQQFFDIGDILSNAGRSQGVTAGGLGDNAALSEVLAQRQKERDSKRGVGSSGAF